MTTADLKAQIQSGMLSNFYVFTGPEVKMMDIYLAQIAKVENAILKKPASLNNLVANKRTNSFISERNIFVLRDCKELLTDDKAQAFIERLRAENDDIYIFVYASLDKRLKFCKEYEDVIVEFEPMRTDVLVKYIQKEIPLDDRHAKVLAEMCESDYSRILLEIDKINQYSKATKVEHNKAFEILANDGTIYDPPYDAIFDFIDAVFQYKPIKSFELLKVCYAVGEATMIILSNLYNNAKQLLQYQSYNGDNIQDATGLTPFQCKLASNRRGVYRNGDLIYLMELVREAEQGIKTGRVDDDIAVENVLAQFWG